MAPPKSIIEAQHLLNKAVKEDNPQRKAEDLRKGLDLLALYIAENSEAPDETLAYIANLRRNYTRRLLQQLVLHHQIVEIEKWIDYIVLLITRLKNEIDYALSQEMSLKRIYNEFCRHWSDALEKALKNYGTRNVNSLPPL
ncbi:MAG: hypothetical protein ABIC39_04130 [Pseudomonadota bacterium]